MAGTKVVPIRVVERCAKADRVLKIGHFAPGGSTEAVGVVGSRINDRLIAGDDIGNQMTGARPDAEAVAAEACSKDETGQGGDLADPRHAVRRAVDIACPGRADGGFLQGGQKLECPRMRKRNGSLVDSRVEDAHGAIAAETRLQAQHSRR